MPCLGGEYVVSEETAPRQREWRPQIYRKCTDTAWLLLFFLFWTGLVFIMGYAVVAGAAGRLLFGYDSYGNVCGKKNSPVEGAPLSGQDMTLKTHMFFMNSCNPEIKDMRLGSTTLCVSSCPEEQLSTLEEIQLFADTNGSFLCVYSLNSFNYTQSPNAGSLCPRLPVPPSKSFPLFNRCIPQTPECYSLFASVLINDVDMLHQILRGIMSGRDTILGLCILALALSLAMMFIFRFITTLLVHIIISLVILGLFFVCGVLWWLYYDYTIDLSIELDTERENMKSVLGFAIVSTIITAILLVLIFVLRKQIKLTVELFKVTNKAVSSSPFLLLQPVWTFAILIFFWVLWVAVLLSLGTAGSAQVIEGGRVEFTPLLGIRYLWWYHLIGLIWTSEFILACQQMTIAGVVVSWYFNRNKNDPSDHPILSSLSTLLCYHQGTVVKGSFFIPLVRIPRVILMYIYDTLKDKHSACSRGAFRCCCCCFSYLARHLYHLNQLGLRITRGLLSFISVQAKGQTSLVADSKSCWHPAPGGQERCRTKKMPVYESCNYRTRKALPGSPPHLLSSGKSWLLRVCTSSSQRLSGMVSLWPPSSLWQCPGTWLSPLWDPAGSPLSKEGLPLSVSHGCCTQSPENSLPKCTQALTLVLFIYLFIWYQESKSGPCTCQACTMPLSYIHGPDVGFRSVSP
ncbi:PREDICTED: choline transporter-like protein 3 isoform X2 [Chinchilla lanigera]|uniref:choline transporter-like protein 3 isoform X2 n=1 Tax=Chinchilla lanigera TaxID=34839 RepID=UPI000696DF30|nr:PREDICTED: choline transporter-like protein 3 isoform X2 [Chinchilla lanigera]